MSLHNIIILTIICFFFTTLAQLQRQDFFTPSTINTKERKLPGVNDIKRYAFYAAAAGCSDTQLTKWGCKACLKASHNSTKFIQSFNNRWFGTRSILTANNFDKKLVLSFRGTENYVNKLFNLIFFTSNLFDNRFGKVHSGFKWLMRSLKPQFVKAVENHINNEEYRGYKLVVTGHSMGGALALLATLELKFSLGLDWDQIELFTYGQPRAGDSTFKTSFKRLPLVAVRGVNFNDQVPNLLKGGIFKGYSHVGNEYFIANKLGSIGRYCDETESTQCSDGVDESLFEKKAHLKFFETRFGPKNAC